MKRPAVRPLGAGQLAVVPAIGYLVLPGHPLSLLPGLPLGPLGLVALVLFGLALFAGGGARPVGGRRWLLLFGGLCLLKLGLASLTPVYGLEASYNGEPGDRKVPERSTEFPGLAATRLDQRLSLADDQFPLYFFNDNLRFNYYQPDEPDRASLPFSVRWQGLLDVPAEGNYRFWLTAVGSAELAIGGTELSVEARERAERVSRAVRLPAGLSPIRAEYERRGGAPAELLVEWDLGGAPTPLAAPYLLARPAPVSGLPAEPFRLAAGALDLLFLLGLAGYSVALVWAALAGERAAARAGARPGLARLERPLLALLLGGVLLYAALTSLELRGRVVLLEGGADWLTYETYARDIQLNGPLMTLGKAIGKGRPYFFQPFYPYALAFGHWLTGEDLYGVVVLQLFGLGLAGVLIYYLGKRLFGAGAGLAALALVLGLLFPLQLDWVARRLLSENLYFWLLPAAALACLAQAERPSTGRALLAGALLGLCCLTRGPTLLWVPPALAIVWRLSKQAGRPGGGRAALVATAACVAVVGLVPLRNHVVARQPSLVATNGMATMELAHPLTERVRLEGTEKTPLYRALRLDESVIRYVEFLRQDPLGYAATLVPLGLYALGLPGMLEPGSAVRWELLGLVGLYGAYALGLGRPLAGRRFRLALAPTWLLHAFIWLHFGVMMVFLPNVYGYRQVLPMYLFLAVFGGQVLAAAAGWLRQRPGPVPAQQGDGQAERRRVEQYVPGAGAAAGHEELA